jgi:hypothetical protein
VTPRLGTGKSINFFYSVVVPVFDVRRRGALSGELLGRRHKQGAPLIFVFVRNGENVSENRFG